jgi:TIR domain
VASKLSRRSRGKITPSTAAARRAARRRVHGPADVFISYSQSSERDLAEALQKGLRQLGKAWNRPRALRVTRDTTDLSATLSTELWESIQSALAESRNFVLMASPASAASKRRRRTDAVL